MLKRLNPHLKKRADELMFIEMKPGKQLGWNGYTIPADVPLPLPVSETARELGPKGMEELSSRLIVDGMIRIIGIDSECPFKEVYGQALRAYQEDIFEVVLESGIREAVEERFEEAMIFFRAALQLNPENPDALYNYGRVLADLAKKHEGKKLETVLDEEAIEVFETLLESTPDLGLGWYHLGFRYANQKAYTKAFQAWDRGLKCQLTEDQEDEIRTLIVQLEDKRVYEEGYNAILKGYFQEGLEKLTALEEHYSDWWNLFFFIGVAHRNLENYEAAIPYLNRVLELHPAHGETHNELGICYLMLMHYSDAEKSFAEGLKHNPSSAELMCNMGILQREKGNLVLAEKFLKQAVETAPEDELSQVWLSKVQQEKALLEGAPNPIN